jgi:Kef-type K+ transport system membrane component KefB
MAPDRSRGDQGLFLFSACPTIAPEEDTVEHVWYTAAAWVGLALLASLISMRIGLCVALVEIFLGSVAGNLGTHLHTAISPPNAWINFLASFGSVVLTFLAGAEIKPESFRRQLVPSLVIGWVL